MSTIGMETRNETHFCRHKQDQKMAVEITTGPEAASSDDGDENIDLNNLARQTLWTVIKKKRVHREKHAKWHNLIYAFCEALSGGMDTETWHLSTVVSLLLKAHSDELRVLEHSKRIVRILEKMSLFPELANLQEEIHLLLDEAKCQVVLQSCNAGCDSEEIQSIVLEYFGISKSPGSSGVGLALKSLLRRRKSKATTADMDRFVEEHSATKFKADLIEFVNSAMTHFETFCENKERVEPQLKDVILTKTEDEVQHEQDETAAEEEEGEGKEEKEGGEEEEEGGDKEEKEGGEEEDEGGDKEEKEGGEVEEECRENEGSGVGSALSCDGEQESEPERMEQDEQDGQIDGQEGGQIDESDNESPIRHKRARNMTADEEEIISWESSLEHTPPTRLPKSRSVVVVRNRESLVKTPAKRRPVFTSNSRNSWSYTETENLIKGVNAVGVGKWATILAQYEFDVSRTATSLKDKWRNIQGRRH